MKNIIISLLLLTLSLSKPHFGANFLTNNKNRNNGGNIFSSNNFENVFIREGQIKNKKITETQEDPFKNKNNGGNIYSSNNFENVFIGEGQIKNIKVTETQEEPFKNIPFTYIQVPQKKEEQEVSYEQQLLSNNNSNDDFTVPQKFESTKYSSKPHKLYEKNMRPFLKFDQEPFNPYGPNSKFKFLGQKEKFIPLIPNINFNNNDLSPEQIQKKILPITEELKNLADTPEQKIPPQQFDRFYEILNGYPDLEPIYEQIQNLNNFPLNQINDDYINDSVNKINELKNEISDNIKESNEKNKETNENIIKSIVKELNKLIDNEIVDKNEVLKNYENIIQIVNNEILHHLIKSYEKINNVEGDYVPISYIEETINDINSEINK